MSVITELLKALRRISHLDEVSVTMFDKGRGEWRFQTLARDALSLVDAHTLRHKKRGSEYILLGNAKVQHSETDNAIIEGAEMIVYIDSSGNLWVRPSAEVAARFEWVPRTDRVA